MAAAAKVGRPKKAAATGAGKKKKGAAAATATHPPYAVMVAEAIKQLRDRTGSSPKAIGKVIADKYHMDVNKVAMTRALKSGVEDGALTKVKASYKIASKPDDTAKPTKKVDAKAKKPAKKAADKKAADKKTKKATSSKPKKTITKKK